MTDITAGHDPDGTPPLTEATFLILLSLTAGPLHGYAIIKIVAQLSQQRMTLSTGTLYGVLKRLLAAGWIERVAERDPDATTRTPIVYELTERGRRMLTAETARLRALVQAADQQIAPEGI
jgi:DNA-binding PadR family transcriptional regulator